MGTMETKQIIDHCSQFTRDHIDLGWEPYLLSFMFNQLRGSPRSIPRQMEKEVERVYGISLTRVVRKPMSENSRDKLPIWIGCPDFPVPKHVKLDLRDVSLNDGRHVHIIALTPSNTRLNTGLDQHFEMCQDLYVRPPYPLRRIHAVPITSRPEYVAEYVFKSLRRRRVNFDQVIILPRDRSELPRSN